jgi:mannosyltransferase OCH1-like enzyme
MTIPRNLHFMWLDKTNDNFTGVPQKYAQNVSDWKRIHPTWQVYIWNNKAIKQLIHKQYPEFEPFINNIKSTICKCDITRFLIVHAYGGVYVDLDFHCYKNLDSLIDDKDILLFREPKEHEEKMKHGLLLNGFFGGSMGHKFFLNWALVMRNTFKEPKTSIDVLQTTGPMGLYTFWLRNPEPITDFCAITPQTHDGSTSRECIGKENDRYAVTIWNDGTSWGEPENMNDGTASLSKQKDGNATIFKVFLVFVGVLSFVCLIACLRLLFA